MIAEPWLAELTAIRAEAARRCGLDAYPAAKIRELEDWEPRGRLAPWRARLAYPYRRRQPITSAARHQVRVTPRSASSG